METLFEMQFQSGMDFPKPLTEEFRPMLISDFVGLDKQKKILSNLVKNPRPCALLFEGASGSGKTTMAQAFATELNAQVWEVGSQECTVDRLREIVAHCHYVPKAGLRGYHVVIVNEADCMSDASQKYLLSKLDSTGQIANTIWVFTCNSTDRLEDRFLSRCIRLDSFNSYGASSGIADLLARVWNLKAPNSVAPNFKRLACGNVRESLQRLETELLAV
jgi:replication-associated recombination protein RarA